MIALVPRIKEGALVSMSYRSISMEIERTIVLTTTEKMTAVGLPVVNGAVSFAL